MTAVERVLKILVEHAVKRGVRDMQTHCRCGWVSAARDDGWYEHARHQAEVVVAGQRQRKAAS